MLRLHRILVLRDLGVPLSEIGTLLDDDVTVEQLRGILLLRRAEARDRLATQTDQLRRVELRLAHKDHRDSAERPRPPECDADSDRDRHKG
jgi:DNA-binding transcriptional MerR regulator